jgi:YgiT-type zinc finger domain-containing protein
MTGNGEGGNPRRCPLCDGDMEDGVTTIPFLMGERVAVIKNVPAEICANCGEAYMKSGVVSRIEAILDRLEELGSEMSVVRYEAA